VCKSLVGKAVTLYSDCASSPILQTTITKCGGTIIDFKHAQKSIDIIVYQSATLQGLMNDVMVKKIIHNNTKTQLVHFDEFMNKYNNKDKNTFQFKCKTTGYLMGKNCAFFQYEDQTLKKQIETCDGNMMDLYGNIEQLDFVIYDKQGSKPPVADTIKWHEVNPDLEIINDADFYNNYVNGDNKKLVKKSHVTPLACLKNKLLKNKTIAFYKRAKTAILEKNIVVCGGILQTDPFDHMNTSVNWDFIVYKAGAKVKEDDDLDAYLKSNKPKKRTIVISDIDFIKDFVNNEQTLASLPFRALRNAYKDKHFYSD
jgi:hypothetical protein